MKTCKTKSGCNSGWATAQILKSSLAPVVAKELHSINSESLDEANNAIKAAFKKLDNSILDAAKAALQTGKPCDSAVMAAIAPAVAGSCALLSIFEPESGNLRVACVGDSRAVLGRKLGDSTGNFEAKALSVDQTGENADEICRIEAEHPNENDLFSGGRLLGIMVTRAFGDYRWKWDADLAEKAYRDFFGLPANPAVCNPPYLTAEPEITCTTVSANDFLIMASDGFWEHMTSENAVVCVSEWLKKKKSQQQSTDNGADERQGANCTSSQNFSDLELHFQDDLRTWKCLPKHFVVEDMDNAAVHLLKNVLGGTRRNLFVATTMMHQPIAKAVHDDITVQVLFF